MVQPISAVSGEYETTTDKQSFCVTLNGESAYALRRNVEGEMIYIPVTVEVSNKIKSDVLLKMESYATNASSGVKKLSMNGRFYTTSDSTTVSRYGLSGSFSYTGTSVSNIGSSHFQDGVTEEWTGTSSTSEENDSSYCTRLINKGTA